MNEKKLQEVKQALISEIDRHDSTILEQYPIVLPVNEIKDYPSISNYKYIGQTYRQFCRDIEKNYDKSILGIYNKLILVNLIEFSHTKLESKNLDKEIIDIYNRRFAKIILKIENKNIKNNAFQIDQDKFLKDFAICSHRALPVGPLNLDVDRLSRGFLFRNNLKQFLSGLFYVYFHLGGFTPFYRMHMNMLDTEGMSEFNEKGWEAMFRRIIKLIRENPKIKGIAGNSWLFDPAIKDISPDLAYISRLVNQYNGRLFSQGTDADSTKNATFLNSKRKKLYLEGTYKPTRYLVIFSRENLLNNA